MAIDPQEFSDDFLDSLSQKLVTSLGDALDDVLLGVDFDPIGKNLTGAITKSIRDTDVPKLLEDKLIKDTKVAKVMTDVKKKVEDALQQMSIGVSDVIIPPQPPMIANVVFNYTNPKPPLPKLVQIPVKFDYSKLEIPSDRSVTIAVDADTSLAEKKLETFSTQQTPITSITQAAQQTPQINTASYDQAGDSVKLFVELLDQASKKTTITSTLYNQILDTANKIVDAKRMEKSAVDDIIASLQSKVALESKQTSKQQTQEVSAALNVDTSSMEKKFDRLINILSVGLGSAFGNINTAPVERVERTVRSIKPVRLFDTQDVSGVLNEAQNLTSELQSIKLTQLAIERSTSEEYAIADRRVRLTRDLRGATTDQLKEVAKTINLDATNYKNNQDLAAAIKKRIVDLYNEKILKEDILDATNAYNAAMRQSKEDLRIKGLIVQLNLTEDEVAQRARLLVLDNERLKVAGKLTTEQQAELDANGGLLKSQVEMLQHDNQHLRHGRESVEIIEHVAQYQKEINEEVEKFSMGWKKVKATAEAILKNPTLAKGIIFASAMDGIHKLNHAMHEFKEVGMSAGEAVNATFRSLSVASVLGISKSADVTKTLAQQFGNLNALTKDQIDSVGKLAYNNGLAGEEATNLVMSMGRMPGMTRETAANSEKMFKEIGKTKGVIPAQIMKEMAKNTANMALYSKGGAEGFAKAAASAKKMGVELSSVLSAAQKTLDFESSINAQMEASAILGREINIDRLREVTMSGDANAILQEQQNLIRQMGGLENMNLLQKQKVAELMGMSVEEMQKINDEAQFQNQYFGEQASLFDNIVGSALKYGGAIGNAAMQFGPLLASIVSLIFQTRMLNLTKMQTNAITATNTGLNATNTGSIVGNTTGVTANTAAGGVWNSVRGIGNSIMGSSIVLWIREKAAVVLSTASKYATIAAETAWNAVRAAGNFLMSTSIGMWIAEKVQIGLSTIAKWANVGATTAQAEANLVAGTTAAGASSGFLAFGAALGTFGTLAAPVVPVLLAIGAAILLATPALYVLGEVVKSLAVVIGNVLMKALEMLPAIIGAVADGFVTIFRELAANWQVLIPLALGIGVLSVSLIGLASAMGMLGGIAMLVAPGLLAVAAVLTAAGISVFLMAEGFSKLKEIEIGTVLDFAVAIGILAATATLLAPAAPFMILGAAGIAALGLALIPMGEALQKIGGTSLKSLTDLGLGLLALAGAASYIGLAAPFIMVGAGALYLLSFAVEPLSEGLRKLSEPMALFVNSMGQLASQVDATKLIMVGAGLTAMAIGIGALALASFVMVPALGALTLLGFGLALFGELIADFVPQIALLATSLLTLSKVNASSISNVGTALESMAPGIAAISDQSAALANVSIGLLILATAVNLLAQAAMPASQGIAALAAGIVTLVSIDPQLLIQTTNNLILIAQSAMLLAYVTPMLFMTAEAFVQLGGALQVFSVGASMAAAVLKQLNPEIIQFLVTMQQLVALIDPIFVLTGALVALSVSIAILGIASAAAFGPVQLLGIAITSVGYGMALVAPNVDIVLQLMTTLAGLGPGLLLASVGILAISGSLALLTIAAIASFLPALMLSFAISRIGNALQGVGQEATLLAASIISLTAIDVSKLDKVADSLARIAASMKEIGFASILSLPVLDMLVGGSVETKNTVAAAPPSPTQPVPASAANTETRTQTTTTNEQSGKDLAALMTKIDQLLSAMPKQVVLKLDGAELAKSNLFNTQAKRYND